MIIEEKFKKDCEIGDYRFTIAINRKMACNAFEKYPKYWESISKSEAIREMAKRYKSKKGDISDEEFADKYFDKASDLLLLNSIIRSESENIVGYLFPQMLEYAGVELKDGKTYEDYALEVIDYCIENDVYESFEDEETGETQIGVLDALFKFVLEAFMSGEEPKKAKVRVKFN